MTPRRAYAISSISLLALCPAAFSLTYDLQQLTPAFSSTSTLFAHNGTTQVVSHQSFAHSFPFHGGWGVSKTSFLFSGRANPVESTLPCRLATVHSKRLTRFLNPLESTLMQNPRGGLSALRRLLRKGQGPRAKCHGHRGRITEHRSRLTSPRLASFFSSTYN